MAVTSISEIDKRINGQRQQPDPSFGTIRRIDVNLINITLFLDGIVIGLVLMWFIHNHRVRRLNLKIRDLKQIIYFLEEI